MLPTLLLAAAALVATGLWAIVTGAPIVVIERGQVLVTAGTVALVGGVLAFGLAAVLAEARGMRRRLDGWEAVLGAGPPEPRLPAAPTLPEPEAPFEDAPPEEEPAPEPRLPPARERPAAPVPLPPIESVTTLGPARAPAAPREDAGAPPGDAPAAAPPVAGPPPAAAAPRPGLLGRALGRRPVVAVSPPREEPAPAAPAREEPAPEPDAGPATDAAPPADEPRGPVAATAPQPAAEPEAPAAEPAPPTAGPEAPRPARTFAVGDTTYVVFADGAIEARRPGGVRRFASLEEVRAYVAAGGRDEEERGG